MKQIIVLFMLFSSCSTAQNHNSNTSPTDKAHYLEQLDKKYPFFPIQLKPFAINTSSSAKKITIAEKLYMLKLMDFVRFVVNTPEFKKEFDLKNATQPTGYTYAFEAEDNINGSQRSIKKGEYYDREVIWAIIKHANITSYIMKSDISGTATALGTQGSVIYGNIDLTSPLVTGDRNNKYPPQDLLVMFDNVNWVEDSFYGDITTISQILFHELIHNTGFNHLNSSPNPIHLQRDTVDMLRDMFRNVIVDQRIAEKYKKELSEYDYYQQKYRHYLDTDTI